MTKVVYFENLFPIGYVYLSVVNTNPSKWFGGTWEAINGRFLLSSSDTYAAGTTGGSEYASAQMEIFSVNSDSYFDYRQQDFSVNYTSSSRHRILYDGSSGNLGESQTMGIKVSNINNNDTLLPPYLVVYMWKRIA